MKLQFLAHAIAAEREQNTANTNDLEVMDQYEINKVKMDGLSNNAVLSNTMRKHLRPRELKRTDTTTSRDRRENK